MFGVVKTPLKRNIFYEALSYRLPLFTQSSSAVAVAGRVLRKHRHDLEYLHGFRGRVPNLTDLPPELSIQVLSHLNATDLCLAACVWQQLATDEILWSGLCRSKYRITDG